MLDDLAANNEKSDFYYGLAYHLNDTWYYHGGLGDSEEIFTAFEKAHTYSIPFPHRLIDKRLSCVVLHRGLQTRSGDRQ